MKSTHSDILHSEEDILMSSRRQEVHYRIYLLNTVAEKMVNQTESLQQSLPRPYRCVHFRLF
jgi:hypothetical protein